MSYESQKHVREDLNSPPFVPVKFLYEIRKLWALLGYSDSKYSCAGSGPQNGQHRTREEEVEHSESNTGGWAGYHTLKAEKGTQELTLGSLAQFEEQEYLKK